MSDPTTWWDTRLQDKETFDFFVENLGGVNMPSRVAARQLAVGLGVKSVLDVGCGPAIDRWVDTGIEWHGVDGSYLLSDYCHDRGHNIDQAPAHALPYRDGSFDLVYSRHVWEHLASWRGPAREACRVARKAVMITFFRPPGLYKEIKVIDGAFYNDYRIADIRAAFEAFWPGCAMREVKLEPQLPYLPDGEVILCVQKRETPK